MTTLRIKNGFKGGTEGFPWLPHVRKENKALITALLSRPPEERPTAAQVKSHKWLTTAHLKPKAPEESSRPAPRPQWWCDVGTRHCLRPSQPTYEGQYDEDDVCYAHPNGQYICCGACYRTGRAMNTELLRRVGGMRATEEGDVRGVEVMAEARVVARRVVVPRAGDWGEAAGAVMADSAAVEPVVHEVGGTTERDAQRETPPAPVVYAVCRVVDEGVLWAPDETVSTMGDASIVASASCVAAAAVAAPPDGAPLFIPSACFDGARIGYVFTSRDRGIGYYWDGMATATDDVHVAAATGDPMMAPGAVRILEGASSVADTHPDAHHHGPAVV